MLKTWETFLIGMGAMDTRLHIERLDKAAECYQDVFSPQACHG